MVKVANLFSPVTGPAETLIKTQPIIFSLLIMYQGLFSGNAIRIPERLRVLFENKIFRFMSLMLIDIHGHKRYRIRIVFDPDILVHHVRTQNTRRA